MGIRLHKAMGYGLTRDKFDEVLVGDRKTRASKLDDDERTVDSIIGDWIGENDEGRKWDVFMQRRWNGVMEIKNYPDHLYDVILTVADVDEDPRALLIIPPGNYRTWQRFDDSLDYQEESLAAGNDGANGWVKVLPGPIYPYIGWMTADGKPLKRSPSNFTSYHVPRGNIPEIPRVVSVLAQASGIFREEDGWRHLRPMIATWWG